MQQEPLAQSPKTQEFCAEFSKLKRLKGKNTSALSTAEVAVIRQLEKAQTESTSPITAAALHIQLRITMANLTSIIERLERKGMILRTQSESDKRVKIITLTSKATEMIATHQAAEIKWIERLTQYLGENDTAELLRLMKRINQYADTIK